MAVVALCLLACPVRAQAPAIVEHIDVEGNRSVPTATILASLSSKVGQPVDPERLRNDRQAVQKLGYFRSVAAPAVAAEGDRARVTFRVVELPLISHIRVLGQTVVPVGDINAGIQSKVGEVLNLPRLQADISAIEKLYRERGYVARVSDEILDEAARSGIVRFQVLEITIADVVFDGVDDRLAARLRARLTQVPAMLYRPAATAADGHALEAVRGVRRAVPEVKAIQPGQVRIIWHINPPPAADRKLSPK